MELRHRILEFSGSKEYETLKAELDKLGVRYKVTSFGSIGGVEKTSIEYFITEDDPHYPLISKLIEKHGIYVQSGLHYSQDDINAAEWLWATAGEYQYPQPADVLGYLQATYDTSKACPVCGIGAIQNRPFRLKRDFTQKRLHFLGLHWVFDEFFVRPEVKKILQENRMGDIEFVQPVLHGTGAPIETVFQMKIKAISGPGLVTEGLFAVTCKLNNEEVVSLKKKGLHLNVPKDKNIYCGRVRYHFPRTMPLTFRRNSMPWSFDVAKSHEYLGGSVQRIILVSQRFASLVGQHKLRGLKFTPVKLV